MKIMLKLFAVVAFLAITASCATTTAPTASAPTALPDKYNLDELKELKSIKVQKTSNWNQVDDSSLIFRDNKNDFYMIVLASPLETSIAHQRVGLVDQGQYVYAGVDKFFIKTAKGRDYYIIQKIYELEGPDQAKQIKERLSK